MGKHISNRGTYRSPVVRAEFVTGYAEGPVRSKITVEQREWAEALSASRPELTGMSIARLSGRQFNRGFTESWGSGIVKRVRSRRALENYTQEENGE